MYAILYGGYITDSVRYDTSEEAWRAVHEIMEEAFGDNYDKHELALYDVVQVAE